MQIGKPPQADDKSRNPAWTARSGDGSRLITICVRDPYERQAIVLNDGLYLAEGDVVGPVRRHPLEEGRRMLEGI
jgi:hypothetical protein